MSYPNEQCAPDKRSIAHITPSGIHEYMRAYTKISPNLSFMILGSISKVTARTAKVGKLIISLWIMYILCIVPCQQLKRA